MNLLDTSAAGSAWDKWDTLSIVVTISALLDFMPKIAALLAVVVWGLRIAQDPLVLGWVSRFRQWRKK